jgi:hypothetical protein
MKNALALVIVPVWLAASAGLALAEDDARVIGSLAHNRPTDHSRTSSVYVSLSGDKAGGLPAVPSGDETRFYLKVWDDLYLQVTTETGESGTAGYMVSFSKDMEDQNALDPVGESKDAPTLREISAADFRTDDNFDSRPLRAGPGTSKDRGPLRVVAYPGFDAEIRVLEFNIGDAKLGKKPFFKNLSFLVMVKEKETKKEPVKKAQARKKRKG